MRIALILGLLGGAGCHRHSPAVHQVVSSRLEPVTLETRFVGIAEGERWGEARLTETRAAGGALLALRLDIEAGGARDRITFERRGERATFDRRFELAGWARRWRGVATEARLVVEEVEGPGAPSVRDVPWGPSSVLDLGHPLSWGSWLRADRQERVRVVRLSPLAPSPIVDHFVLELHGEDAQGTRLWIRTRAGPVAIWVDDAGRPVRARWRPGGRGAPRVEWRPGYF